MKKTKDIVFLEELVVDFLQLFLDMAHNFILNKDINILLYKTIRKLVKNIEEWYDMDGKSQTVYIYYTWKSMLQRYGKPIQPDAFQEQENCEILSFLNGQERDLIMYKRFMLFSNLQISKILHIPMLKVKRKLEAITTKLKNLIRRVMD